MFGDRLGEIWMHKFCSGCEPVRVFLPNRNPFQRPVSVVTVRVQDEVSERLQRGFFGIVHPNGRHLQPGGQGVSAGGTLEAFFAAIVHIKRHEPVGQIRIVQRMSGGAPFSEQNQIRAEAIQKSIFPRGSP